LTFFEGPKSRPPPLHQIAPFLDPFVRGCLLAPQVEDIQVAGRTDTDNNAFTVQESNVWRLYEAIDWSQPDQIAHYIKGVGTSGVRAFALIDGATGIGVPPVSAKYETDGATKLPHLPG
jgi:hypothetical protein